MNRKNILVLLIVCAAFIRCTDKKPQQSNVVPVNLYTVKTQKVFYYDKYPANTVALSQVDLRPEVQGYITAMDFKEGDHVKKGQKLYEIDQRLFQQAYDQAKANLDVAKGNLTEAQQDADRYTYLNKTDAIAKQTLDHAIITLDNAKNSVKAAEEAVKTTETNLTYSTISAPFDGTIGISQVRLGNMVTVGTSVLNTISTDDPMGVDFLISEKQLQHFEDIKDNNQQAVDSLFTIVTPDGSLYPYTGKILIIDRAVNTQTGTIDVRLTFPNPKYSLRPGLSCVVRVHNQDTTPEMVVPNKAVVELMGEYFVYLAKDTVARNQDDSTKTHPVMIALQRKIQPGRIIDPNIIIKGGIKPGDRIVVDGVQSLHTGSVISAGQKPDGAGKAADHGKKDSAKKN